MEAKTILVTGDQGLDYDIYLYSDEDNPRPGLPPTIVRASTGGAGLVARLLNAASKIDDQTALRFYTNFLPYSHIPPNYITAIWRPCPPGNLIKTSDKEPPKIWRTKRSMSLGEVTNNSQLPQPDKLGLIPPDNAKLAADILYLEDDAEGYRFRPQEKIIELLGKALNHNPRWVIFKTSSPVCCGNLWWSLCKSTSIANHLVVVVPIMNLRLSSAVRISHGISWERTAEDLTRELSENPELAELRRAKHVIVTLHGEGALWMERLDDAKPVFKFRLIFDPANIETEWSQKTGIEGDSYGYNCCFAASISAHCACSEDDNAENWLKSGIKSGLWAKRAMRVLGHGFFADQNPGLPVSLLGQLLKSDKPELHASQKCNQVEWKKLGSFGECEIPLSKNSTRSWHILEEADKPKHDQPLYGMARRVALVGTSALPNMPYSRFGDLFTADRDEIEALRNLKLLIQEYETNKKETKPLSLAVFGPPGAGKSFGIKQIAIEVLGKKAPCLVFNLSQFSNAGDLIGAFHQVRDKVLEGHMPVVFWDEFDSEGYKWLQYLLAPMQDGKFQEGQLTHPIGRCVFVFAGATSYTYKNFGPPNSADEKAHNDFILKKGPDFISRLQGYLDVLGPNPRQKWVGSSWEDDQEDRCFPVRRAILLRSLLGLMDDKHEKHRLNMDHGLLVALLEIGHYKYGSRSFEIIIASLKQNSNHGYRRSNLPANESLSIGFKEQLGEFMDLLNEFQVFQNHANKLAPAIHQFFLDLCRKNNWPIKYDMLFDELPEAIKKDNVTAAMRIPWILGLAGLTLVESSVFSEDEVKIATEVIEYNIELLAAEEHNLWMEDKINGGWRHSETRNDGNLEHDCLLPFEKLAEKQKAKDRDAVMNFPKIVQMAGFKIIVRQRRKPNNGDGAQSTMPKP
jgi:hypothetical protein